VGFVMFYFILIGLYSCFLVFFF